MLDYKLDYNQYFLINTRLLINYMNYVISHENIYYNEATDSFY